MKAAAEEYVATDSAQAGEFARTMADWEAADVGQEPAGREASDAAGATDRRAYDPYEGNPELAGSPPGAGTGEEYVTE